MPNRVLLLASSVGGGDWPPIIATALALQERGHAVVCAGDTWLAERLADVPLKIHPVPSGRELYSYIELAVGPRSWSSLPHMADVFLRWAKDNLAFLQDLASAFLPDIIVCNDTTLPWGVLLRRATRAPLCMLNSTFCYQHPSCHLESDFAGSSVQWAGWLIELGSEADLVLHAVDPVFDSSAASAEGVETENWVGPLFWEDTTAPVPDCVLTDGPPWVLVSLSSARQDGELRIAETAIDVLANTGYRVMVTLSDPDSQDEKLPTLKNVQVARYVPHSIILRSATLVICHAGYGTVAKSMYHGVPMVLVPWARDQPGVAARASALGIARIVPRELLNGRSLDVAMDHVLGDDKYRRVAAQHAARLQSCDSGANACRRITEAITLGKRNDGAHRAEAGRFDRKPSKPMHPTAATEPFGQVADQRIRGRGG